MLPIFIIDVLKQVLARQVLALLHDVRKSLVIDRHFVFYTTLAAKTE